MPVLLKPVSSFVSSVVSLSSCSTLTSPKSASPIILSTLEPALDSHGPTSTETGKPKSITRSLIPGKLDATILASAFAVPPNEPEEYFAL